MDRGQRDGDIPLADELFQRCLALRPPDQRATPVTLYDPCCGGATLLCTLAILHWSSIRQIVASDADFLSWRGKSCRPLRLSHVA